MTIRIPSVIPNFIGGEERFARNGNRMKKMNPADGTILCELSRSTNEDVNDAIGEARKASAEWSEKAAVQRGMILYEIVSEMKKNRDDIARIVHTETGKSMKDAIGETDGAIALGLFFAGEGQRLYGKTMSSAVVGKSVQTVRQPIGIAGLIIAANTPIANVAWKIFPALVCGNTVVLKAAEDAPATAWIVGELAKTAGLPNGVMNILHGTGAEAGQPLVEHPDIGVISFTGSTEVGLRIAKIAANRLSKVSLELGGKNPFVVCDDADMDLAVKWVLLSAFSNAGQRCASASRIIIFSSVYEQFTKRLIEETAKLRIGTRDDDDLGPVINEGHLLKMIGIVDDALQNGAECLVGGNRLQKSPYKNGYYMNPTLIENAPQKHEISSKELFGPVACLYKAKDFGDALNLANDTEYGLTACIHTKSIHRAMAFSQEVKAGVVNINAGTFGSEPHMPFGGLKKSGNGTREPGTEALEIYTQLKNISISFDSGHV